MLQWSPDTYPRECCQYSTFCLTIICCQKLWSKSQQSKAQQSYDKFLTNLGPGRMRSPRICCFSHIFLMQGVLGSFGLSMQPQSFVSALRRFDVFGRSYWGEAGDRIGGSLRWLHSSFWIMCHQNHVPKFSYNLFTATIYSLYWMQAKAGHGSQFGDNVSP